MRGNHLGLVLSNVIHSLSECQRGCCQPGSVYLVTQKGYMPQSTNNGLEQNFWKALACGLHRFCTPETSTWQKSKIELSEMLQERNDGKPMCRSGSIGYLFFIHIFLSWPRSLPCGPSGHRTCPSVDGPGCPYDSSFGTGKSGAAVSVAPVGPEQHPPMIVGGHQGVELGFQGGNALVLSVNLHVWLRNFLKDCLLKFFLSIS